MMATNHMLTGAVIALSVQKPLLIVPIALVSHFVLDTVPHFGVNEHDASLEKKYRLFQYVLILDIALTIAMLIAIPFLLRDTLSWWIIMLGMVSAWLPDSVWVYRFIFKEIQATKEHAYHWLTRFHQKIQWFERPVGLVTELLWFGAMSIFIGLMKV